MQAQIFKNRYTKHGVTVTTIQIKMYILLITKMYFIRYLRILKILIFCDK